LKRHEREVHGDHAHVCLIAGCKRNRRGFSRRNNFLQHLRRAHPRNESSSPQASGVAEVSVDIEEHQKEEVQMGMQTDMGRDDEGNAWLSKKLKDLEEFRRATNAKIDRDIAAVKQLLLS
jgi:hypothetical protein